MTILNLANVYTGSKFSTPPTKDEAYVLAACSKIILRDYVCLSLDELDEAFSLAVSGQFEGISIETYYGDFTPKILGTILKSYLVYRRKVLGTYNEFDQLERNRQVKVNLDFQNKNTHLHVFDEYKKLKENWISNGDIKTVEKLATPYWAKILIRHGIIDFTAEQKKEIWEEAKELVKKEITKEITDSPDQTPANRRNLVSILRRIASGEQDDAYENKARNKYAKLIIIKSIISS